MLRKVANTHTLSSFINIGSSGMAKVKDTEKRKSGGKWKDQRKNKL